MLLLPLHALSWGAHCVLRLLRRALSARVRIAGVDVWYDVLAVSGTALQTFEPLGRWAERSHGAFGLTRVWVRHLERTSGVPRCLVLEVPGAVPRTVVLAHSPSVAALLWFSRQGERFVLLVRRPCLGAGEWRWEVPTGVGTTEDEVDAALFRELREETSVRVRLRDLLWLPSAALWNEPLRLVASRVEETDVPSDASSVRAFSVEDPVARADAKLRLLLETARWEGAIL